MDITIAESEVPLSVKGHGTVGVSYTDGVNTVILARLRNGRLGQLCKYCNGEGVYTPSTRAAEKRFGKTMCNGGCRGTGIRRVYADEQAGLDAAERYLRHLRMTPEQRERFYEAEQEAWYGEHADLVAAATRYAAESRSLRDLLRSLRTGQMRWTPAQMRAVYSILDNIENPPPSRFAGEPGKPLEFTGIIEKTTIARKQFGTQMFAVVIYGDEDCAETILVMHGGANAIRDLVGQEGMWIRAIATVQGHRKNLRCKETLVGAPKVLETSETRGADKRSWPGTLTFTGRDGLHTTLKARDGEHAHRLLPIVFSGLRYGLPERVQLTWAGQDEVTVFDAGDVLANDPDGSYAALLELCDTAAPAAEPEPEAAEATPDMWELLAASMLCDVDGCDRKRTCDGLCDMHYRRRRRGMPNWDTPGLLRAAPREGFCGHDHPRTPENTVTTESGARRCKTCQRETSQQVRAARRAADAEALRAWLSSAA